VHFGLYDGFYKVPINRLAILMNIAFVLSGIRVYTKLLFNYISGYKKEKEENSIYIVFLCNITSEQAVF
jgi:hypothetical protein